jgi:hypothetical protein
VAVPGRARPSCESENEDRKKTRNEQSMIKSVVILKRENVDRKQDNRKSN